MVELTGKRIREIRNTKKMTIARLAEMVEVSKSLISQVERGEVLPSLSTLEKIAIALDVPITEFFNVKESSNIENRIVVRKNERKKIIIPNSETVYHVLTPDLRKNVEFLIIEFPPKSDNVDYDVFRHEGEECFLVLEGELTMTVGEQEFELQEGDSGSFNSDIKHGVYNKSDKRASLLVAAFRI